MTLPRLIKEAEASPGLWQRSVRDAVNLLTRRTLSSGPTSERPANPDVGTVHYDVTLHKPVWWSGTGWKDATGASA